MEAAINEPKTNQEAWGTAALEERRERSRRHLAAIASRRESWIKRNRYYYELLVRLLRFLVEPQKKVLSVRCGTGYHLAAVAPKQGKGVDICAEIVEIARQQNPSFELAVAFPDKDEFRQLFEPARTPASDSSEPKGQAEVPKKESSIPPEAYVCPKPFKRSEIPVSVQLRYYVLGEVSDYCWQREVKEVGDENRYANRIQNHVSIRPI